MQKLLNRIQSGPGLFILFLVSLSVFFSLSLNSPASNSFNKVVSHSQILPGMALDTIEFDDWNDELDFEEQTFFSGLLKPVQQSTSLLTLTSTFQISFLKAPLLYFLFAIPPPRL